MNPTIPELDQLEKLASSTDPTLAGAWAHTLQLVDHLYNSFCKRDPNNNEVLFERWTSMFEELDKLGLNNANRPIPFDTLHQLYDYSSRAIEKISQNPSKKMMKETAMVSPNRLRSPRMKTINWIAKQPGRNIREKLAGKNRVLTEQNIYSIQTKENAVFVKVLKTFIMEFQNRFENGINTEFFDVQERDIELNDEIETFLKSIPKLMRNELGEVKVIPVTQPNNMLMNDKYYSIIWRTYQLLNARQHNVKVSWEYALERFVFFTYIRFVSILAQHEGWMLEDGLGKIGDINGKLSIEHYENSNPSSFRFFLKPLEGSIIMVNKEKGWGFLKTKQYPKVFFNKSLFDEDTFNRLKSKDIVYVHVAENRKGVSANYCSFTPIVQSITIRNHDLTIEFVLEEWVRRFDEAGYQQSGSESWTYHFAERKEMPKVNRGVPIHIKGHTTGIEAPDYVLESFADMSGMNQFIDHVMMKLGKNYPVAPRVDSIENPFNIRNAGIDFTKAIPMLRVNDEPWINNVYSMLQFTNGYETVLFPPNPAHLYSSGKKVYSLYHTFHPKDAHYQGIMQSYSMIMGELGAKLPANVETPFIYLVPDNIDEFAQKDIKKALSVQFPTSFPIWRSVAGSLAVEKDILSAKANTILVIDTHGHEASAIKLIRKKYQNKYYFQHYPPFEAPRKSTDVTMECYFLDYFQLYQRKYKVSFTKAQVEHLLHSGVAEKLLLLKQDALLVGDSVSKPIELIYDRELAEQAQKKWVTGFSQYIYQLQEGLREEHVSNIDFIVFLGDHVFDKNQLKDLFKERFKVNYCAIVDTNQALAAVVNDTVNAKLAESQPLWFEYLPDLSLEVVKNGHYSRLQLIKDEAIGNTMGIGKVFEVKEHLSLPEGIRMVRFPLIRGGSTKAELDAIIKDSSFPLRADMEVKLSIEYKYGYENSYRLFIEPIHANAPFKRIEAEWVEESEKELQTKSHLDIPSSVMNAAELERDVEKLSSFMEATEKIISRRLPKEFADQETLKRAHRLFHSTIYHLRRIVVQDHELADEFIDNFYNSYLFDYCLNIDGYIADHLYTDYKWQIQNFKTDIWRYLCSFGEHIHQDVWDYVMEDLDEMDDKVGMALLYRNSDDQELLAFLEKRVKKNPQTVIRSLRDTLWRDRQLLLNIYRFNPKIIDAMYQEIYSTIKRVYKRQQALKPRVFRDYCEVLLAILELRDKPEFHSLRIGSTTMRKLAKYVRDVDARCYEDANEPLPSFLQFDLKKPDDLWKMSDLAFVVNAYLTGELMDNLIAVREISIE